MFINKSFAYYTLAKLVGLYQKPWDYIRMCIYHLSVLYYKDKNKVPHKLIGWCFFGKNSISDTTVNIIRFGSIIIELSTILGIDMRNLAILQIYLNISVHRKIVSNEDYDAFWKTMHSKHDSLPKAVLEFCFYTGDLNKKSHAWRMESDPKYKLAMNKWLNQCTEGANKDVGNAD